MRRSGSSEIAGRDRPLRPAMLHGELLRLPAVIRRVGLQKTAIYEKMRQAEFSKPVDIGVKARARHSSEVGIWTAKQCVRSSALVEHVG
jgi:predicted DNA-binding transcriptional regulator AlpA